MGGKYKNFLGENHTKLFVTEHHLSSLHTQYTVIWSHFVDGKFLKKALMVCKIRWSLSLIRIGSHNTQSFT
jgi:hypothetical protein